MVPMSSDCIILFQFEKAKIQKQVQMYLTVSISQNQTKPIKPFKKNLTNSIIV